MFPNLKLQIWRTGLRQNRVAQMLQIDETILSKILNGFREPSPELKSKLSSLLQCDPVWLFEKEDIVHELGVKQEEELPGQPETLPIPASLDGASK